MTPRPVNLPRIDAGPLARPPGTRPADRPPGHGGEGASFAANLARAEVPKVAQPVVPPPGEKWEPVAGHPNYADIISGPRNGSYVNLMDGPRRGQAFNVVHREGRTFHVYDEGRDRTVVEVKRQAPHDRVVEPRQGETWRQVPGHAHYRLIEGGERDGHYINVSGNRRHGETFTIERRDGHTHHVYETGELIHVVRRDGPGGARAH